MAYLLLGAFLLSILHALIPNHWFPLVVIGKGNKWTQREVVTATFITGFAHISSTILVGVAIGVLGYQLSSVYRSFAGTVAPAILVLIGLASIYLYLRQGPHEHEHDHHLAGRKGLSKRTIILSLAVALFFSPCFELEAYYLKAGSYGWFGILSVSAVYLIVTVCGMAALVLLSYRGIDRLHWCFLEEREKLIIGLMLILLGGVTAFID